VYNKQFIAQHQPSYPVEDKPAPHDAWWPADRCFVPHPVPVHTPRWQSGFCNVDRGAPLWLLVGWLLACLLILS
jgi:hypothetical protein